VTADGQALKRPFNPEPRAADIHLHPYSTRCCANKIEGMTAVAGTVLELKLSHYVTTLGTRLRFKVELGGDVQVGRAPRVLYSAEFEVGTATKCA
jgi:hypothetical protein